MLSRPLALSRSKRRILVPLFFGYFIFSTALAADSEIDQHRVENLALFARVYGYVRFFHPSDEAAAVDWNRFAVLAAEEMRNAPTPDAARDTLLRWFRPLAPTLQLRQRDSSPPLTTVSAGQRTTRWQHFGVQLFDELDGYRSPYRSRRVLSGESDGPRAARLPAPPDLPDRIEAAVGRGLHLSLPMVLPVDDAGHTPSASTSGEFELLQKRIAGVDMKTLAFTDWRLRIASVITTWNVFQHFHPYLSGAEIDWPATLGPALRRALADRTADDFYLTLSSLVARLEDGHGYVWGREPRGGLPIRVEVAENRIVVVAAEDGTPLRRGDIIARFDEADALARLADQESRVSGSPQLRRHRALNQYTDGALGAVARLEIVREGERLTLETKREPEPGGIFYNPIVEFHHPTFAELRPGIFYVNLPSFDAAEWNALVPKLAQARGIVFDHRSNDGSVRGKAPLNLDEHIIPHLIDREARGAPTRIPIIHTPDRAGWTWQEGRTFSVSSRAPRFTGRIAIIDVPSIVSYGETCTAFVAYERLATLVGEPTAGCNGGVNFIPLPGGLKIMWTGMEVMKHDRSPLYRVGYAPDEPVERTLAAVREGRDEYLERAVAVIEAAGPTRVP